MDYTVNVIGLGYIGLPTAIMLAKHGIRTIGTDVNEILLAKLRKGEVTFNESGLAEEFNEAIKKGLKFSRNIEKCDVYIIAVPTPYEQLSKKINTSFVENAVNDVINNCNDGAIIVIESTISPGTIDRSIRPLVSKKKEELGWSIHLAHAPERIIPGRMMLELTTNNRVIGVDDPEIGKILSEIYGSFCNGEIRITDIRTAEMTKVVENTYRDINIAFANELAKICHVAGINVYEVIETANMHPRVNILQPGPGVGGHCISVDPWFLVGDYPGLANIILAARKINDSMPEYTLNRAYEIMKEKHIGDLSRIGIYGITYKEDVDDIRESPTLQLIEAMKKHLAPTPKSYDPYVEKKILENQYHDLNIFLNDVDFIIVMVAHKQLKDNPSVLKGKVVLDTRNIKGLEEAFRL